jgi:hypothetical protein
MGALLQIPTRPQSISRERWSAYVLAVRESSDWRRDLERIEKMIAQERQELLAMLLDGAVIEGGGQIDLDA